MLEKLKRILNSSNISEKNGKHDTFLSIIGRSYDEDLISRIVAYCLSTDKSFVKQLVERYLHNHRDHEVCLDLSAIQNLSVYPEKAMGFGRADIFAEFTDAKGQKVTLTIENKIYSHEHETGEQYQTQVYYDWVTRRYEYASAVNTFFYLKPDYNCSLPRCDAFENLTYAELCGMLEAGDNPIIRDFISHIQYALRGDHVKFEETERLLLDNYEAFEEKRAEATKKVKAYQDMLIQRVSEKLGVSIVDWRKAQTGDKTEFLSEKVNYGAGIQSFRLYREGWYKEGEHYFYVEIKFEYSCLNRIYFQCTLRDDEKGKEQHSVNKFLVDNPDYKNAKPDGKYYVIGQHPFNSENWGTPEWESEFIKEATQYLSIYITRMDQAFAEYERFKTD
jgi:hypothetical protein